MHDFKLGGVSESSELSEQARVVAEENEYENGRMTGANSSKKGVNCAWTSELHGHSAAHRANLEPESPRASGSQSNTTRAQMVRPRAHPTALQRLGCPEFPRAKPETDFHTGATLTHAVGHGFNTLEQQLELLFMPMFATNKWW